MDDKTLQRFVSKVSFRESGCWEWIAATGPDGYGWFWIDGRNDYAHRASVILFVGAIPKDLTVDHLCRNRKCVNPDHLEVVTNRINVLRGMGLAAINARKTACKHGHPFTVKNTYYDKNGGRACRPCTAARMRRIWAERKAEGLRRES